MLLTFACGLARLACAQNVSQPAILQFYEAKWSTIENRMADVHAAGYGALWLPPPTKGGGGLSVGYDLFDRFDLGKPRDETLYGTEKSFQTLTGNSHKAGVTVYADLILNHNGFGDRFDAAFVAAGGYPGFALTLPNDVNGDFHDQTLGADVNVLEGRLSDLVDINQSKNYQFIRHPVTPGDPQNIPAGTFNNLPNANNARLYPDRDTAGVTLNDPALGTTVTRYNFNSANPMAGDAVPENALGLLMRSAQWLIQTQGVDGFRIDAAKHFPEWVLDYLDQAVFKANPRLNLDGSSQSVYSFSELLDGNRGYLQSFIRRDGPTVSIPANNNTVTGNRDAMDFPLFFAMRSNLTGNGAVNNWHGIRNASQDNHDDGLTNGSAGVSFVDSHDNIAGGFPFLKNVAYAYTLMKPGQSIVYFNAGEFGDRDFPNDGKVDALGGLYGDTITKLVGLRNTHGRGDYKERWLDDAFNPNGFSNIYVYERSKSAVVALNSRADAGYDERNGVQTDFNPGQVLVELTGNANDAAVDPNNDIAATLRVDGSGKINVRIPRNDTHGRGYVIYGLPGPQGALSIGGSTTSLAAGTPTAATNGTTRLNAIPVVTGNSFSINLETNPVTLAAPVGESTSYRDFSADGDNAVFKINEGLNLNGNGGVDYVTPGSVVYGFEEFTTTRTPGFIAGPSGNTGSGTGTYSQTIDTTQLSEGRHYITARAFRERSDGGPAIFTDFSETIYVDRLPPEPQIVSFAPFTSAPTVGQNRDLIVKSVDGTASSMHFFMNFPASFTDAQMRQFAIFGQGTSFYHDRDQFINGITNVNSGNNVITVVTFEPTGNYSVRRFAGVSITDGRGRGLGDMNINSQLDTTDISLFRNMLYAQNSQFAPMADVTADGRIDNRDLFALDDSLTGASQAVWDAYDSVLRLRGDFDTSGQTTASDFVALRSAFGTPSWLYDLNVDGAVNTADLQTFITEVVRTVPGDYNFDGAVDAADYSVWRDSSGGIGAALVADGDFDGDVDSADLAVWSGAFGFLRTTLPAAATAAAAAVPEPQSIAMLWLLCAGGVGRRFLRFSKG